MDLSVLSLCEPCYTNGCCGINEDAHINRRRLIYMHSDLRRSDVSFHSKYQDTHISKFRN